MVQTRFAVFTFGTTLAIRYPTLKIETRTNRKESAYGRAAYLDAENEAGDQENDRAGNQGENGLHSRNRREQQRRADGSHPKALEYLGVAITRDGQG